MSREFKFELIAVLPRPRRHALARSGSTDAADDLVQAACERACLDLTGNVTDGARK